MGDRETATGKFGEKRLDISHFVPARRRVAIMSDGANTLEPLQHVRFRERITNKASMPFGEKLFAVETDYACRFLSAMLQGMEAKRGQCRSILVSEDAKYTAFLMQLVAVIRQVGKITGHLHVPGSRWRPFRQRLSLFSGGFFITGGLEPLDDGFFRIVWQKLDDALTY